MTKNEVMQQALEALEACIDYIAPHTLQGEEDADTAEEAITAIKAVLAQPEEQQSCDKQEPVAPGYCKRCKDYTIEEPLFGQPRQPKREWIEISEQEMPEELRNNWQFIAGIVWAQGKLKEKNK